MRECISDPIPVHSHALSPLFLTLSPHIQIPIIKLIFSLFLSLLSPHQQQKRDESTEQLSKKAREKEREREESSESLTSENEEGGEEGESHRTEERGGIFGIFRKKR